MALPVIPQAPGIVIQIRTGDSAPLERGQCFATVKAGGVIYKSENVFGHAQVRHDGIAHATHRTQSHQPFFDGLGNKTQQGRIDEQVHPGSVRCLAENVEHVAHAVTHRINQMEALAAGALMMADEIERIHHKIDWNDVDPAAFQPHHRHPRRQQFAYALDQLEKVVRPVDLVHLAGDAMAHHHGGTKHRPGQRAFIAHDFFALVLGLEIGVIVVFSFFEHVFAEHAFIQARSSYRADMVEMTGINRLGKFNRVAGAFNVDGNLAFLVSLQVIHRRQMVEIGNFALEFFCVFSADA